MKTASYVTGSSVLTGLKYFIALFFYDTAKETAVKIVRGVTSSYMADYTLKLLGFRQKEGYAETKDKLEEQLFQVS